MTHLPAVVVVLAVLARIGGNAVRRYDDRRFERERADADDDVNYFRAMRDLMLTSDERMPTLKDIELPGQSR